MQHQHQQQPQHQHHSHVQRRKSHSQHAAPHVPVSSLEEESYQGDKPTWFEIFINLFYLAFLIKLGDIFLYCRHSLEIYLYTIAMFLGIYMNKFEMDLYLSKYGFNDVVNKVFLVLYSTGIFVMILNVNATTVEFGNSGLLVQFHQECHEYRNYVVGFSAGWLITRGSMLIMNLIISYTLSDTYILISKVPIIVCSLLIVMLNLILRDDTYDDEFSSVKFLLTAALLEYVGFAMWGMFIVGTLLHPHIEHMMATVKVNIHRQTSRTAAFGLVTLGVSVVELMTPILHSSGVQHYVSMCLAFVILLSLSINFFDVIPAKGAEHAMSNSKLQGTAWMMLQPVLSYCVFGVGMILKMLLSEDIDETLHEQESDVTLGIFLGLASLLLMFIRLTHRVRSTMNRGRWITAFCRLLISLGHFLVGFYLGYPLHVHVSLSVHATLCAAYVLVDVAKYAGNTNILYLQIYSMQARGEEEAVIINVDEQFVDDDSKLQSASHSFSSHDGGTHSFSSTTRGNTFVSMPSNANEGKIQIPVRYASSSMIHGISSQPRVTGMQMVGGGKQSEGKIVIARRPSDGKILITRRPSEGKIQLVRKPSEGKIQLVRKSSEGKIQMIRRPSEGKIQLPRSLSSTSALNRSFNSSISDPDEFSTRKQVIVKRRISKPSDLMTKPSSRPNSPPQQDRIRVARQFKSSTDVNQAMGSGQIRSISGGGGGISPTGGTVVKNDKGQFVLETVVDTPDGGRKVQQSVLHRVVTTKKVKRSKDGGGGGSSSATETVPNAIVVRKIKSANNMNQSDGGDGNAIFETAKNALEHLDSENLENETEQTDHAHEEGSFQSSDRSKNTPNESPNKLKENLPQLETQGSSVVLVDDDEDEDTEGGDTQGEERRISRTTSIPRVTTLSRGASFTLSGSDSLAVKENIRD